MVPEDLLGRYFLCTVGEIILVVIGILIALGIYNWNDPRIPEDLDKEKLLAEKKLEALVIGRIFQTRKQKELYDETLNLAYQLISRINSDISCYHMQ